VKDSGTAANDQIEEDLVRSKVEEVPRSPPRVDSPMAQDLDFIKDGCHLVKYISTAMNTEVKQADIRGASR
jgi:hypothetical protein